MANGYRVTIKNISTDGTNLFVEISIFDGLRTLPSIFPVFPVGTSAADITAYAQVVANNGPTLTRDLQDLVNSSVAGA